MRPPAQQFGHAIGATLLAVVVVACNKDPAAGSDAVTPEAAPAVEFIGRCINETSGVPYQSIYFFPKKGEMFFYLGATGAWRAPVTIVKQAPRKLEFTFRWSDEDEKDSPTSTRAGSVAAVETKWQFELEGLKGSSCQPLPSRNVYTLLPDLGIAAGKWEDPKAHFGIVIAADAQAWVVALNGESTLVHYRVLDHSDSGTLVTTWGKTPSDTDPEKWAVSRLRRTDTGLKHELQDLTANYRLVVAAPPTPKF